MAESLRPDQDETQDVGAGLESVDEDDTSGHSMSNYEFIRQEARQRGRDSAEWARREGVRRESRGLIDRLRRR